MGANGEVGSVLGRLFAIVEAAEVACKVGIRDEEETVCSKLFSTASKTPQCVYPEILRTYYACIKRIYRNSKGKATRLDGLFDGVSSMLEGYRIPKALNEADQCDFFIAYRMQRREFSWLNYGKGEAWHE